MQIKISRENGPKLGLKKKKKNLLESICIFRENNYYVLEKYTHLLNGLAENSSLLAIISTLTIEGQRNVVDKTWLLETNSLDL